MNKSGDSMKVVRSVWSSLIRHKTPAATTSIFRFTFASTYITLAFIQNSCNGIHTVFHAVSVSSSPILLWRASGLYPIHVSIRTLRQHQRVMMGKYPCCKEILWKKYDSRTISGESLAKE